MEGRASATRPNLPNIDGENGSAQLSQKCTCTSPCYTGSYLPLTPKVTKIEHKQHIYTAKAAAHSTSHHCLVCSAATQDGIWQKQQKSTFRERENNMTQFENSTHVSCTQVSRVMDKNLTTTKWSIALMISCCAVKRPRLSSTMSLNFALRSYYDIQGTVIIRCTDRRYVSAMATPCHCTASVTVTRQYVECRSTHSTSEASYVITVSLHLFIIPGPNFHRSLSSYHLLLSDQSRRTSLMHG